MELLPIGSKRRTEVLSDAPKQGIEVIDHLKVEIMFLTVRARTLSLNISRDLGRIRLERLDRIKPRKV